MTDPYDTPTSANPESAHESEQNHTPPEPAPIDAAATAAPAAPIESLIAAIRASLISGATAEARASGATACRAILTVLESRPGQPLAAGAQPAPPLGSPLASLLSQPGALAKLAALPREQLIDLMKQLSGAMPTRAPNPTTTGPRFHLIEIPQVRRPGSGT